LAFFDTSTSFGVVNFHYDDQVEKPTADVAQNDIEGIQASSVVAVPAHGFASTGQWVFSWMDDEDSKRKLVLADSRGAKVGEGYVELDSTDWEDPSTWMGAHDAVMSFGVENFHYDDEALVQVPFDGMTCSASIFWPGDIDFADCTAEVLKDTLTWEEGNWGAHFSSWLMVVFDQPKRISQLHVYRVSDPSDLRPCGYNVEYQVNGAEWITACAKKSSDLSRNDEADLDKYDTCCLDANVAISAVRINVTDLASNCFRLAGLKIYAQAYPSAPNAVFTRSNAAGVEVFKDVGATAALGDGFDGYWIFTWMEQDKRRLVLTDSNGAKVGEGYAPPRSSDWEYPSSWIVEDDTTTASTSFTIDSFHYPNQAEPIADFSQSNIEGTQASCLGIPAIGSGYAGKWIFYWMDDDNDIRKLVLTDSNGTKVKEGYVASSSADWEDPSMWLRVDYGCASLRLENFHYAGQVWKQSLDEMTTSSAWTLAGKGDMIDVAIQDMDLPAVTDGGKAGNGKAASQEVCIHVRPDNHEKESAPQLLEDARMPQGPLKEGHFSIPRTPKTPNLPPKTPHSPKSPKDHSICVIDDEDCDCAVCDEFGVDAIVDQCNLDELSAAGSGGKDRQMAIVGDGYYNDNMVLADEYCNAEDIDHYNLDDLENANLSAREHTNISHRDP
jgi:hypothetical protein